VEDPLRDWPPRSTALGPQAASQANLPSAVAASSFNGNNRPSFEPDSSGPKRKHVETADDAVDKEAVGRSKKTKIENK
jgi:hypothetical protein